MQGSSNPHVCAHARPLTRRLRWAERSILAGFEHMEEQPTVMLLMGNFQSTACAADAAAMRENFSALAAVLLRFPRLLVRTGFRVLGSWVFNT